MNTSGDKDAGRAPIKEFLSDGKKVKGNELAARKREVGRWQRRGGGICRGEGEERARFAGKKRME
jgi:hypothetical protein